MVKKLTGSLGDSSFTIIEAKKDAPITQALTNERDQALVVVMIEKEKDEAMASLCVGLGVGYKKPVLVLKKDTHKLSRQVAGQISGQEPQIRLETFVSPAEALSIILAFIQKKHHADRRRFDVNLRHDLYEFISQEAKKHGISRSEMIRRILAA